jgi:acid phosphatase type 7
VSRVRARYATSMIAAMLVVVLAWVLPLSEGPSHAVRAAELSYGLGGGPLRSLGDVAASPVPPATEATIVAAGDIACDPGSPLFNHGRGKPRWCRARDTARLIAGIDPAAVLPLGDDQYDDGRLGKFRRSYDLGWGHQRWRSRPVLGNHEYEASSRAAGYFAYFGRRAGPSDRGWYSYDLGAWHLIALNSNCLLVRCDPGSPQMTWLDGDLTDHPSTCTLAYFHHPRFSSGPHGDDPELLLLRPMWRALYAAGVDVVLNGHDHLYERFAPMDPHGFADRSFGVRQFTVGTGGAEHYPVERVRYESQVRNSTTFGVLQMSLLPSAYAWRFVPVEGGRFTDVGRDTCHAAP